LSVELSRDSCQYGYEFPERFTNPTEINSYIESIENRQTAGGFSEQPGGFYRPDSTAWAVLVLAHERRNPKLIQSGRDSLTASQLSSGCVFYPQANNVSWPTSLAVLAWHGSHGHQDAQKRALNFLLETSGTHWKKEPNSPIAHDTGLKGWGWTAGTHSFVEPTSLAILALDIAGYHEHPRFKEGISLLINRQLPHGGWNYGNTQVYGKELFPFIDTTGVALAALSGHVDKAEVEHSLLYLRMQAQGCNTPLSLAWALFGLGAWGEFPSEGHAWLEQAFNQQKKFGVYRTTLMSPLVLAYLCAGDFRKCVAGK
jgi:hypothetical protein